MEKFSCYQCNHEPICVVKQGIFEVLSRHYFIKADEEYLEEIYTPIAKNCKKFDLFKGDSNEN